MDRKRIPPDCLPAVVTEDQGLVAWDLATLAAKRGQVLNMNPVDVYDLLVLAAVGFRAQVEAADELKRRRHGR